MDASCCVDVTVGITDLLRPPSSTPSDPPPMIRPRSRRPHTCCDGLKSTATVGIDPQRRVSRRTVTLAGCNGFDPRVCIFFPLLCFTYVRGHIKYPTSRHRSLLPSRQHTVSPADDAAAASTTAPAAPTHFRQRRRRGRCAARRRAACQTAFRLACSPI